jgi:hypothetical protein
MKKYIFFLFSLLCCIYATAQTEYEVITESPLTVRSQPGSDAPIVGTLENERILMVYDCSDGWAQILHNNEYAYVEAKYLKDMADYDNENQSASEGVNVRWMVVLIAVLSLILFVFRRMSSRGKAITDSMWRVNLIVFFITMISEITYIAISPNFDDVIWFCIPDEVGWLWTVIDFVIFLCLMCNQVQCIFSLINDIQYKNNCKFGIRFGLYTIIGGIVAVVLSFSFFRNLTLYIVIAAALCQIIQIAIMVRAILPNGGWRNAVLCISVYLLGVVATAALFAYLFILLLVVLVGYVVLRILPSLNNNSNRCSNCANRSGNTCILSGAHIDDPERMVCDQHT